MHNLSSPADAGEVILVGAGAGQSVIRTLVAGAARFFLATQIEREKIVINFSSSPHPFKQLNL